MRTDDGAWVAGWKIPFTDYHLLVQLPEITLDGDIIMVEGGLVGLCHTDIINVVKMLNEADNKIEVTE